MKLTIEEIAACLAQADEIATILHTADVNRPCLSPDLVMESQVVQQLIIHSMDEFRSRLGKDLQLSIHPPEHKGGSWEVRVE